MYAGTEKLKKTESFYFKDKFINPQCVPHIDDTTLSVEDYKHISKKGRLGEAIALTQLNNALIDRYRPYHLLHNIRVPHSDGFYELDGLVIMNNMVLVVEIKNIGGQFEGNSASETWQQSYQDGITGELVLRNIPNPEHQLKRNVDAMQEYLASKDIDLKVKGLLLLASTADTTNVKQGYQGLIYHGRINHIHKRNILSIVDSVSVKRTKHAKPRKKLTKQERLDLKAGVIDLQVLFAEKYGQNIRYEQIDKQLRQDRTKVKKVM